MAIIVLTPNSVPTFEVKETYDGEYLAIQIVPGLLTGQFKLTISDVKTGSQVPSSVEALKEKEFINRVVEFAPNEIPEIKEAKIYYGDIWQMTDGKPYVRAELEIIRQPAIRFAAAFSGTVEGGGFAAPAFTSLGSALLSDNGDGTYTATFTAPTYTGTPYPAMSVVSTKFGSATVADTASVTVTAVVGSTRALTRKYSIVSDEGGPITRAVAVTVPAGVAAAVAPSFTSSNPGAQSWTVGDAVSRTFTASGTAPVTFAATGLPADLALSSGGVLSGQPNAATSGTITVTASNGTAPDATQTFSFAVAAAVVAPVNTVLPGITGTAQEGETLVRSKGTWSDGAGNSYDTQWSADGVAIPDATTTVYVPVAGDVGKTITVTVTATNAAGSTSATSTATAAVMAQTIPDQTVTQGSDTSAARPATDGRVIWTGFVYPDNFDPALDELDLQRFPVWTTQPTATAGDGSVTTEPPSLYAYADGYQVKLGSTVTEYTKAELSALGNSVTPSTPNDDPAVVSWSAWTEIPNIVLGPDGIQMSVPGRNYMRDGAGALAFSPTISVTPVAAAAPPPSFTETTPDQTYYVDTPITPIDFSQIAIGTGTLTFSIGVAGSKPRGINLSSAGIWDGAPEKESDSPTYIRVTQTDGQFAQTTFNVNVVATYEQKVQARPDLKGYWNELSENVALDKSGNGKDATGSFAVEPSASGPRSRSFSFGSAIAELNFPTLGLSATGARTIIAYVNGAAASQLSNFPGIVFLGEKNTSPGGQFSLEMRSAANYFAQLAVNSGYSRSTTPLLDDTWRQIAVTVKASGNTTDVKFYVNGSPDTVSASSAMALSLTTGKPGRIGGSIIGLIAEVQVYERELTATEIADDYTEANA